MACLVYVQRGELEIKGWSLTIWARCIFCLRSHKYFSAGFESHGVLVTTHTCICKFASTKCKGYKYNMQVINSMCHSTTSFHTLLYTNLIHVANHSLAESLNKFLYLINKRLIFIFLIFF